MKRRPPLVPGSASVPARRLASKAPGRASTQRGEGEALAPAVKSSFQTRFGHDFGNVRIHHDADAAASAASQGADAYTVGEDIYFAAGRYRPDSAAGRHLLAHELAHTVQQAGAAAEAGPDAATSHADASAEQAATDAAARVMRGHAPQTLAPTALGIARQPARIAKGTSGHLKADDNWSYVVYDKEVKLRYYRSLPKDEAEARAKKKLPGFVQVGAIPWVTNNPGNITQTAGADANTLQGFPAANEMGSLGAYGGRYAIFESTGAGVDAIGTYLRKLASFGTNPDMTLAQAIKQYKGEEKGEKQKRLDREQANAEHAKKGEPLEARVDVREDYLADVTRRSQDRMVAGEALDVGEEVKNLTPSQLRELKGMANQRLGDLMKKRAADIPAGDGTLKQVVESIHEVEGKANAPGVRYTCEGFVDPTGSAAYDGEQKAAIKALLGSDGAAKELQSLLGCGP